MTATLLARFRGLLAALLLVALPLAAAACSDDDDGGDDAGGSPSDTADDAADDTTDDTGGDAGDAEPTFTLTGFEYEDITVAAGEEVVIQNDSSAPHTFTADDDAFDSGEIAAGDSGGATAPDEAGDYPFHCEIHPDMQATLTVE